MFHIYKASITEYRVLNVETGQFEHIDAKGLTIRNPRFVCESTGYFKAKRNEFKNSGDPLDYFAYIETDEMPLITEALDPELILKCNLQCVKFNPFKERYFFDTETLEPIKEAATCIISGNFLAYYRKIS